MNKILRAMFSFIIVIVLVIGGLIYLADITERKESKNKFGEFYEQEEDYDVLFLGSSHVLNGVYPMELWNDYGIVSYNMGTHGGRTAGSYWVLKNALEYTKPKLVVVDCFMISMDEKISSAEKLHMATDHIPFSKTKIEMIYDMVEDKERHRDFLWKFSTYHNRWNELTEEDFEHQHSLEKGAESRIGVAMPDETIVGEFPYKLGADTNGKEYLCRIIEECQEQGIQVLLTYIPFPDNIGWQLESDYVWKIAEKYNVGYLDYQTLRAQLNFTTDCYDRDSHLNPSGARKVTAYIGNYISNTYVIADQRENEAYSKWHADYEVYTQFKHDNIRYANNLKTYLMLLKDENLSYGIYLNKEFDEDSYVVINGLLLNLGINPVQVKEQGKCFVFVDNINNTQSMMSDLESIDTDFGEISLIYNEEGELELISKDDNQIIVSSSDIAIVVFDNKTLSMVDQATFKTDSLEFNMKKQSN